MEGCRILVVEDDPLISTHLEAIIAQAIEADVMVAASIAQAECALGEAIDFAFLDVDVLDGKTHAFASNLSSRAIPFACLSASQREAVPSGLRSAPFVAKPYSAHDIVSLPRDAGKAPSGG